MLPYQTARAAPSERASRRALELAAVALFAVLAAATGTALHDWPLPTVHDEFSYLLAGETLASGRLANPPHPLPQFFETFHILQSPSYVSKYFPGHALFLATGIRIAGSPRLGQWLAFAGMAMALTWCLRGWVGRTFALSVSALSVLVLASTSWATGYFGAPVAMLGAALLFGAFGPLRKRGARVGVFAGAGAALLALTRPWEGFWVCVPATIGVAWWLAHPTSQFRHRLARTVLPGVAALAAGLFFLARYNESATGEWTVPPYVVYERSAAGAPPFVWQEAEAPTRALRATERARMPFDLGPYNQLRTDPIRSLVQRAFSAVDFFGGRVVAAALLLVLCVPRRRAYVLPVAAVAAAIVAIGVSSFFMPHYLAPAIPALLILVAAGAERVWSWHSRARLAVPIMTAASLVAALIRLAVPLEGQRLIVEPSYWANQRDDLARHLDTLSGGHVVFVRYAPTYQARHEWVQNRANRDTAHVLWVHDLGEHANAELLGVATGRRAWMVEVEDPTREIKPVLRPYPVDGEFASRSHRDASRRGAAWAE